MRCVFRSEQFVNEALVDIVLSKRDIYSMNDSRLKIKQLSRAVYEIDTLTTYNLETYIV